MSDGPPNQAPRLEPHDAWTCDPTMQFWLRTFAPGTADDPQRQESLHAIGLAAGSWHLQDLADRANRITPELRAYDRTGRRIDDVVFDASWNEMLATMKSCGGCGMPWNHSPDGYLLRAAAMEKWSRLDIGALCPLSMTTAAVPVLAATLGRDHDLVAGLIRPDADHLLAGMAMTEPQGGSDLAGSTVRAEPAPDGTFNLYGHKWFVSHPVADILLVLAREPGLPDGSRGLSCFLVRGWLEDGSRNAIEIQRLKDKLGTKSLASGEVKFTGAHAERLGEPGAGVRTIIEMVVHTRMDCSIGSTGVMSRAVQEAVHHASHRRAFGALLVDQPLMRAVLADLALEREAAAALTMEVARLFDADNDPLRRLVPAIAKYWITRRAVSVAIEACEALGGNGYTEEYVLGRLYRDAQVNSTWEGSGNVIVLDVFRALATDRDATLLPALTRRIDDLLAGDTTGLSELVHARMPQPPASEADGRSFVGRLACVLQAALLVHRATRTHDAADAAIANAFVQTRLYDGGPRVFGDAGTLLLDAAPALLPRLQPASLARA